MTRKGIARADNANAAGPALIPASVGVNNRSIAVADLDEGKSGFEPPRDSRDLESGLDERVFEGGGEHRLVLHDENARVLRRRSGCHVFPPVIASRRSRPVAAIEGRSKRGVEALVACSAIPGLGGMAIREYGLAARSDRFGNYSRSGRDNAADGRALAATARKARGAQPYRQRRAPLRRPRRARAGARLLASAPDAESAVAGSVASSGPE